MVIFFLDNSNSMIYPKVTIAVIGSNVIFKCFGQYSIIWTFRGIKLINPKLFLNNGQILFLKNVDFQSAGDYYCISGLELVNEEKGRAKLVVVSKFDAGIKSVFIYISKVCL